MTNLKQNRSTWIQKVVIVQYRDGTGQHFLDPTGKFQNLRRLTVFLQKIFVCYSMHLMKNFQKWGAHGSGVKIYDSGWRSQKKNVKFFFVFCKNNSILRLFWVKFRFERPGLSSAKRAQNKHKKNWRAQAKLSDVLANDILRRSRKEVKIFLLLVTDYLQFAAQQTLNCYDIG